MLVIPIRRCCYYSVSPKPWSRLPAPSAVLPHEGPYCVKAGREFAGEWPARRLRTRAMTAQTRTRVSLCFIERRRDESAHDRDDQTDRVRAETERTKKQRPHQMPPAGTLPNPLFPCRDRDAFCTADSFKLKGVREGVHEYKRRVSTAGWGSVSPRRLPVPLMA